MFTEVQKFSKWWMVAIGGSMVFPILAILNYENPFRGEIFDNYGILFVLLIQLLLLILFALLTLKVEVTSDGVVMSYFPLFVHNHFEWSEIQHAKVLDYGFVGGWGIRFWTKYGKVYNTRGSKGVEFVLKNGKHFVIGTQQPEEWKKLLKKHWE